ncbi:MAG: type II toxin-antitoxin system RelE family toxin [Planctomycetota bacterium]|jgi:mRNA interferase RelE/StbE
MYHIEIKSQAQKFIAKQQKKIQRKILKQIRSLKTDAHPPNSKQLHGPENVEVFSLRTGDYRIIYQIQEKPPLIIIAKIGQRGDVYKRLLKGMYIL